MLRDHSPVRCPSDALIIYSAVSRVKVLIREGQIFQFNRSVKRIHRDILTLSVCEPGYTAEVIFVVEKRFKEAEEHGLAFAPDNIVNERMLLHELLCPE